MTLFHIAACCSAFSPETVGAKVLDRRLFDEALEKALASYDTARDGVAGQMCIELPPDAYGTVSAGVGCRAGRILADHVIRRHQGRYEVFLQRAFAAPVTQLHVIVYTREAYLADPQIPVAEARQLGEATHVIMAVHVGAGPSVPLEVRIHAGSTGLMTPYRFVHGLAGGNLAAAMWTPQEIHEIAKEVIAYDEMWCTVAD
jgi:hypothetical protein